jgi:hypothetical protein
MGAQLGSVVLNGVQTPVPRFESAESETKKVTRAPAGDITLEGLWCYNLKTTLSGPSGRNRARKAYLLAVKDNGFKIGVKVKQGQQVTLSFRGYRGWITLTQNVNVTNDLTATFGADPQDQWIGLVPPVGAVRRPAVQKGLHLCYKYTMTVTAVGPTPQLVPVVVTYGGQASFASHYLLDVRIFTVEPAKIKTMVAAIK